MTSRGYSDADLAEVSDHPEWTKAKLAKARPFAEIFPEIAKNLDAAPPLSSGKRLVAVQLDQEVLDSFVSSGPGWQSRINDVLRKAAGLR